MALTLRVLLSAASKDMAQGLPAGPLMVLSPHPDDETLGAGALIARYRAQGEVVCIILITNGDAAAVRDVSDKKAVATLRKNEALSAAFKLGVPEKNLLFLNYPDGSLNTRVGEIEADLLSEIETLHPALIVSPFPEKCHPDHQALAKAIRSLVTKRKVMCPVFEYPIWFYPHKTFVCLMVLLWQKRQRKISAGPYIRQKHRALISYGTQFYGQPSAEQRLLFKKIVKIPALCPHEIFFAFKPDRAD